MQRSSPFIGALLFLFTAMAGDRAAAQSADGANADYDQRLQRLEEQIVDLNAQLGTVQTMAGGGGGAASGGDQFSGGGAGLGQLETQVQALSAQMSDLVRRLEQIEARFGGIPPSQQPGRDGGTNYGDARPAEEGTGFSVGGDTAPQGGGFGTTIEQGAGSGGQPQRSGATFGGGGSIASPSGGTPVRVAARSSPEAEALYSQAYNSIVQRNYRAASNEFEQFVQSFPNDPLAGQAHYWLAEAAFINGDYRQAADMFLRSASDYPQNEKAPESLLKLGIALKRLGENDAACSSFDELQRRFPNAAPVLQRAEREKQRASCG